jgi:hypothetical protein
MDNNVLEIVSVCNDEIEQVIDRINMINGLLKQIEQNKFNPKIIDNIFVCGQKDREFHVNAELIGYNCGKYFFKNCKISYNMLIRKYDSDNHSQFSLAVSFCPDCFLKFANEFLIVEQYEQKKEIEIIIDGKYQKNKFTIQYNYLARHSFFRENKEEWWPNRLREIMSESKGFNKDELENNISETKQKYNSSHAIIPSQDEMRERHDLNKKLVIQLNKIASYETSLDYSVKNLISLLPKSI